MVAATSSSTNLVWRSLPAPSAINVGAGQASTFTVGGGGSGTQFVGYKASSSNTQVAAVSLSGTTLTINGIAAGAAIVNVTGSAGANVVPVTAATSGSATVVVFDSKGASAQFSLNVSSANTSVTLSSATPNNVDLGTNATASYQIAGAGLRTPSPAATPTSRRQRSPARP